MNRSPTNEGRIVDARLLVKIGVLFFRASARLGKAVKKGPDRVHDMLKSVRAEKCLVRDDCAGLAFPSGPTEESC